MPDEDFRISFKADTETAIASMQRLLDVALNTEKAINSATNSLGKAAGAPGLSRIVTDTQASKKAVDAFNASVDNLVKSFKNLSKEAQAALAQDIKTTLPRVQGRIELQQKAGLPVSKADLDSAERILANISAGLKSAKAGTDEVADAERKLNAIRNTRSTQQAAIDNERLAAAEAKAAAAAEKQAQAELVKQRATAQKLDAQIAKALAQPEPPANTADLLNKGIAAQQVLAERGFKQSANMVNIYRGALERLTPAEDKQVAAIRREISALNEAIERRRILNQQPTGQQLASGVQLFGALKDRGVQLNDANIINEATAGQKKFSEQLDQSRFRLDEFNKAFGTHAKRIAEGLLIYNAFGRALDAVRSSIQLVANTGVELTRFEAVAGAISETKLDEFVNKLGQVAVDTNTPLQDLIATSDQVTAALARQGESADVTADRVAEFQRVAGEFSNVLGLEGNQQEVTTQLVALFRQVSAAGGGMSDFKRLMDQIVVAGNNSSTVIQQVTQGLVELAPAANATGVSLSFASTILSELVRDTGRTGNEIGSLLQTTFAKLRDVDVVKKAFDEVGLGIVKIRDEAGNLLPAQKILENFFAAVKSGQLSQPIATNILQQLGPPLSPGAIGINAALLQAGLRTTDRLGAGGDVASAAGNLEQLSEKLVDTLTGHLGQLVQQFTRTIAIGFAEPIKESVESVVDALKKLSAILNNGVVQAFITWGARIGLVVTAIVLLNGAVTRARDLFVTFRGVVRALVAEWGAVASGQATASAALATTGTAAQTTTTIVDSTGKALSTVNAAAGGMQRSASIWKIGLQGIVAAAGAAIPTLIALAAAATIGKISDLASESEAIDQLGSVGQTKIRGIAGGVFTPGGTVAAPPPGVQGVATTLDPSQKAAIFTLADLLKNVAKPADDASEAIKNQYKNVEFLKQKIVELATVHDLDEGKAQALLNVFLDSNGAFKTQAVHLEDVNKALSDYSLSLSNLGKEEKKTGGDIDELTADMLAQKRAAEVLRDAMTLTADKIRAFGELNKKLATGGLTQEDFADQFKSINDAADLAARATVILGDKVKQLPGIADVMARTGKTAQQALFDMFRANPDALGNISEIISQAEQFQQNLDQINVNLHNNPIAPVADPSKLLEGTVTGIKIISSFVEGTDLANRHFKNQPLTPRMNLLPLAQQAQRYIAMMQGLIGANNVFGRLFGAFNTGLAKNINQQLAGTGGGDALRFADDFAKALATTLGNVIKAPSASETAATKQTPIIDIGDLPASSINQIIAIATAAQKKVVAAGGTVDTKEIAALFKGTEFESLVKGIDQRFLQKAIEELTNVEKKRLELEQQRLQDVTRNTVVRVGPIQSLVSAPVLAAGGGVLSGQGLNADPRLGNITINVPINWSGMSLKQLQDFIYKSISQAWIDAGRGA